MSALARRYALSLLVLGLLGALHLLTLLRAPAAWLPAAIEVRLRPGEALGLGAQELAAPRAATRQLVLSRDAGGRWMVRNLDAGQPLVLRAGDARRRSSELALAAGQRIQVGGARLAIASAGDGVVEFGDGRHTWRYDGATVSRDGAPQPACPDTPAAARLAALWNRFALHALTLARPLTLGGNLYCGNRVAAPGAETGSAAIARRPDGALALSVRGSQPVLAGWEDIAQRQHALDGIDTIALGRTAFGVQMEGGALRLLPRGQVGLYASPAAPLPPQVRWQWQERRAWNMPAPPGLAWAGALAVLLAAAVLAAPERGRRLRVWAAGLLAAAALLVLVTQRSAAAPGAGISLLLAWGALLLVLVWTRRPQPLAISAALLLGAGLLVQLDMGMGAHDTAWLRHFQNTAALLAVGLPAALALLACVGRGAVSRPAAERILLLLAGAALAALLAQVWLGDETGVFDMQPVEFAKLALAALSAHCLALAAGSAGSMRRDWRFWLRMAAPVLLFVFLLAAALVRVDDYSPLVLLLVWAGAMALAWCWATGRRGAAWMLACGACAALLGGAALQRSADTLGSFGFYPERFQVWNDPAVHPHTGQQMLLGLRAVAQGGWLGAGGALGLGNLGRPAAEVLAIPAVQDDFAPSWLLNRHGLAAALGLWCVQALFLAALLRAAVLAWRQSCGAGDFRRAWLGRFQCFALCGGAAFVAGHLLLSWGTNLAMFPIMGQPMSFLSSGGSHLLFFICPLLAFGMASVQFHEESQSCRSMSNTKS